MFIVKIYKKDGLILKYKILEKRKFKLIENLFYIETSKESIFIMKDSIDYISISEIKEV